MPAITATSLRSEVSRQLRAWILNGRLAAGSRITESRLTKQLGVSRTPLREALLSLEQEGLVQSKTNKGFRVAPLDPQEVAELYPILGALESTAIRLGGTQLITVCPRLREINEKIVAGGTSSALYRLDLQWHKSLWSSCPNRNLIDLISVLKIRICRFDGAFERGVADVPNSCNQHDAITSEIEKGDIESAAALLEDHWNQGTQVVIDWIELQTNTGSE